MYCLVLRARSCDGAHCWHFLLLKVLGGGSREGIGRVSGLGGPIPNPVMGTTRDSCRYSPETLPRYAF